MKLTKYQEDIRIMIFSQDGTIDAIFGPTDKNGNNTIKIEDATSESTINKLKQYQAQLINKENRQDTLSDRHLFYLKEFLKNNYIEEFKSIKRNPQKIMDDTLLYYYLTRLNKIVLINSSSHTNILCIPSEGITEKQLEKLETINELFSKETNWEIADNMHIEIYDGYGFLNIGDTYKIKTNEIIDEYKNNTKRKIK